MPIFKSRIWNKHGKNKNMCNKEFTKFYCKKHERNKTNLWLKDVLKIGVEQTKGYESPISYLYLLGELVQSTFDLVQLLVDWKSIKMELGIN
jgi:hypothetical protein